MQRSVTHQRALTTKTQEITLVLPQYKLCILEWFSGLGAVKMNVVKHQTKQNIYAQLTVVVD